MKSRMILGFGICLPLALLFLLLAWGFFLVVGMGYDRFIIITGEIIQGKHLMIIFITWVSLGVIVGMGLRSIFLTNKDTHIHHMHTIERIGYVMSIVDTFPEDERKKLLHVLNSLLVTKNGG